MRALARRVARIEAGKVADNPVPRILRVAVGETQAEAHARFAAEYPNRKPGHCVLVVPATPRTEVELEVWANRFREQQIGLVNAARRERIDVVKADRSTTNEPRSSFPKGGVVAPPRGRAFKPWIRNS